MNQYKTRDGWDVNPKWVYDWVYHIVAEQAGPVKQGSMQTAN